MKLILVALAIALFPLGLATAAWADPAQPSLIPATSSSSEADSLGVQEINVGTPTDDRTEQLDQLANQVNEDAENTRGQEADESFPGIEEVLNLPEGVVVQGTRGGGLTIGTEF
ncbi:MAG: hypothetical protein HC769_03190 [Cyanobacteria bacterium CRU_2_1]|nr:hypothetical protein [Cyanobacteria bacterium CRU_2_1]